MSSEDRVARAREKLTTVAVTGTNGKTTTASMIEAIVSASGEPGARVTTLGSWVAGTLLAEHLSIDEFVLAAERAGDAGARTFVVETTSQALAHGFAHWWPAQVAVFTNLSRDHLDVHASPEEYLAAKAQLFTTVAAGGVAVLNACDPSAALIAEVVPSGVRVAWYAVGEPCSECPQKLQLAAREVSVDRAGTRISLAPSELADKLAGELSTTAIGEVHAGNALAAALAAAALDYPADAIGRGLAGFSGVPGRFEMVADEPLVVVDFAHTPDALERTLQLARQLAADGRVICVFGCGGERDRGKRMQMGQVAVEQADVAIVTSDNPRGEDPRAIVDDILEGTRGGAAECIVELDRKRAIHAAVGLARRDEDVVVIAGRGHERVQIVGDTALPLSDAEVARGAHASVVSDKDIER